jgi:starvation-inducible DNA-binding protein
MKMHPTRNDIPEAARKQIIELLQPRLAETIDLNLQSKQAHWNVKGPHFLALHQLFDQVYEKTGEAVDTLAERIVQLGGTADGTIQAVAKASKLTAYPMTISTGKEHLEALAGAVALAGKSVRKAIDHATEMRDADTADILTSISEEFDKQLWFIEAHLEN